MIFRISKEKCWDSSSGIERWPEMLKKLPNHIKLNDKNKVAEDYFGMKKDEGGRLNGAYEVYGLFGAEYKNREVHIAGSNLIRKADEGYVLSDDALNLVEAYEKNDKWEVLLTQQLLKYSLRSRAIFISLLNGGKLFFPAGYLKNMSKSYIEFNGEKYFIFSGKPHIKNINDLMRLYPDKTVGEFWIREFNIEQDDSQTIEIQGISSENPSINSISVQIKIPMVLFEYLGWIKETDIGYYSLDREKVKAQISPQVWDGLIIEDSTDDIEILKGIIKENCDYRGYFPVSIVGEMLKKRIDPDSELPADKWVDRYFMTGIKENKFRLAAYEQGQPRHGIGLLGRKDYQLIKIEFSE